MADFGIFAEEQRLKVTNEVKVLAKVVIIPCQMGFKQQDGRWVNEWIDVTVFQGANYDLAQSVQKRDQITVSGRLTMKEYNGKKSWNILCDKLEVGGGSGTQPQYAPQSGGYVPPEQDEDVPF